MSANAHRFELTPPVNPTDHALGPAHAAVTIRHFPLESGHASGARATPTFFVNGTILDVSFGLKTLFDQVERALVA